MKIEDEESPAELFFQEVKPFSWYQGILLLLMSHTALFCGALVNYPMFGQYVPESHCDLETDGNLTFKETQSFLMNNETYYTRNCQLQEQFITINNDSSCENHIYDLSQMAETIVTKFDLGCSKSVQNSLLTSISFIGYSIGSAIGGNISDQFGRIKTVILFLSLSIISTGALIMLPSIFSYGSMRLLQMTFAIAAFGPVITYVFEITGSEYRAQVTSLMTGLPWAVGQAYVAFLAQMTRHWQWAMVTLVAIAAPFPLMYYFFVPESYVFLCSKERFYDARKVFEKFPKLSRAEIEERKKAVPKVEDNPMNSIISMTSFTSISMSSKSGVGAIFKNKFMGFHFIVLLTMWLSCAVLFYGLLFYAGTLPGSIFTTVYYATVSDILSFGVMVILVTKMNRKTFVKTFFTIGATTCYIGCFMLNFPEYELYVRYFALVGRMAICGLYSVIFLIAAELFPTPVRSTATAIGMASCSVGGFFCPLIINLGEISIWLPYLVFGGFALLGSLMGFLLPETKQNGVMHTMEEGYKFHEKSFYKLFGNSESKILNIIKNICS